jgi:TatD DNase family protein
MSDTPPPIIDTHAHLDDAAFSSDLDDVLERARAAGVRRVLNIAYRPDIWDESVRLREEYPEIELAAGIHPQDAAVFDPSQADALAERLLALQPLAIGEAGFDFARPGPGFDQQRDAFRWQIELAMASGLPLVIHQREAGEALTAELDCWPDITNVVLHSFDGDDRLAAWAVDRGFFVGIGGLACRKSSHALRKALRLVPVEKLLLETDAPYLAPPRANSRRNEPANLPLVAETLAPLWDLKAEELCLRTADNARKIFGFQPLP